MDHFELTERLRAKANVTYEEARAALERHDWDLLEAVVDLEHQGKTRKEPAKDAVNGQAAHASSYRPLEQLGAKVKGAAERAGRNTFDIHRGGRLLFRIPLLAAVLVVVFGCRSILPLLLLGVVFGWRYHLNYEADSANGSKQQSMAQ